MDSMNKSKECVFCGYAFNSREKHDIQELLHHTMDCMAQVCSREGLNFSLEIAKRKKPKQSTQQISPMKSMFELFPQGCRIAEPYMDQETLLSLALVNKSVFHCVKEFITCRVWFHLAKCSRPKQRLLECNNHGSLTYKFYQPTKCIASHPSQFYNGITHLKLAAGTDKSIYTKELNFPATTTHLDISKIELRLQCNWPPMLHTLVFCDYAPLSELPATLKALHIAGYAGRWENGILSQKKLQQIESLTLPTDLQELRSYGPLNFQVPPLCDYKYQVMDYTCGQSDKIPNFVSNVFIYNYSHKMPFPDLPPQLKRLIINGNDDIRVPSLPNNLSYLQVIARIETMATLPSSLKGLYIDYTAQGMRLKGDFPFLKYLFCPSGFIEGLSLPPSLEHLVVNEGLASLECEVGDLAICTCSEERTMQYWNDVCGMPVSH